MSNKNEQPTDEPKEKPKKTEVKLETEKKRTVFPAIDWSEMAQFIIAITLIITFSFIVYKLISPLTTTTTETSTIKDISGYKDMINLLTTIYGAWIASIIGFYFGKKSGQTLQESMREQLDYTKAFQELLAGSGIASTISHELTKAATDITETKIELKSIDEKIEELEKEEGSED